MQSLKDSFRFLFVTGCLWVALIMAMSAQAQKPTSPRDTSARVTALIIGYESLMERYQQLQPVDSSVEAASDDPKLALDGLVVDETRTHMGRDFYDVFYREWESLDAPINQTVRVQEQPSPGRGTLVSILVNGESIARVRLRPRYAFIERTAQQAAQYVQRRLQQQSTNNLAP